jgi:hypothetical protein
MVRAPRPKVIRVFMKRFLSLEKIYRRTICSLGGGTAGFSL